MRSLADPIARRGNLEDTVSGRFLEGRFRAQPLLDETAIVACMASLDLNPIRADNKDCLPMTLEDYLKLLDWTGRQIRTDKRAVPIQRHVLRFWTVWTAAKRSIQAASI